MKYLLSLLLISVVIISGCAFSTQPQKNVVTEASSKASRLTNRGVTLDFIGGAPPQDEIHSEFPFRVKILLKNHGSKEVSGTVKLSDSPRDDLEAIPDTTESFFILGVDEDTKIVREKEIDFGSNFIYPLSLLTHTDIILELEYDYVAEISTTLCIKGEDAIVSDQTCNPKRTISGSELSYDAQHAPVTITRIDQEIFPLVGGADIFLTLMFEDFGGSFGWINNPDNILDISGRIELQGRPFTCSENILRFTEPIKTRKIECRLSISIEEGNFFKAPLKISLDYPYKSIITTKSIPIKHRKEVPFASLD